MANYVIQAPVFRSRRGGGNDLGVLVFWKGHPGEWRIDSCAGRRSLNAGWLYEVYDAHTGLLSSQLANERDITEVGEFEECWRS